jgi:hypothetical protein
MDDFFAVGMVVGGAGDRELKRRFWAGACRAAWSLDGLYDAPPGAASAPFFAAGPVAFQSAMRRR